RPRPARVSRRKQKHFPNPRLLGRQFARVCGVGGKARRSAVKDNCFFPPWAHFSKLSLSYSLKVFVRASFLDVFRIDSPPARANPFRPIEILPRKEPAASRSNRRPPCFRYVFRWSAASTQSKPDEARTRSRTPRRRTLAASALLVYLWRKTA